MSVRKIDAMHKRYGIGEGFCKDCPHFVEHLWDKKYFKCSVYGSSHSEATDWRKSYIACGLINKPFPHGDRRIVKMLTPDKNDNEQIPGQIEMEIFGG